MRIAWPFYPHQKLLAQTSHVAPQRRTHQSLAGNAATQSCALPVSAFAANTPASPSPRAMHGRARHALRHRCGAMRETIVCRTAR